MLFNKANLQPIDKNMTFHTAKLLAYDSDSFETYQKDLENISLISIEKQFARILIREFSVTILTNDMQLEYDKSSKEFYIIEKRTL